MDKNTQIITRSKSKGTMDEVGNKSTYSPEGAQRDVHEAKGLSDEEEIYSDAGTEIESEDDEGTEVGSDAGTEMGSDRDQEEDQEEDYDTEANENSEEEGDEDELPVSQIPDEKEPDLAAIFRELVSIKYDLREDIGTLSEEFRQARVDLFSKVDQANEKAEQAIVQCEVLEEKNKSLQRENEILKDRVLALEVYSKRDNLIIEGIAQHKQEDCTQKVKKFFRDKLEIENDVTLISCHRLYNGLFNANNNRPMICRFLYQHERNQVWAARFSLKGSNYYLKEHFPNEINRRRSLLYPILKRAKSQKLKATIKVDRLIIESQSYTVDTLDTLPPNLNAAEAATQRNEKVTAFFTVANPLSNFYPTPLLKIDGTKYSSVEQYLQSQKAVFAEQLQTAAKIRETPNPATCKSLGDRVAVNSEEWLPKAIELVRKACRIKFREDPHAQRFLLNTGSTTLIEAGPDKIWGVGAKLNDPQILSEKTWEGSRNLLGNILMSVRDELKLQT